MYSRFVDIAPGATVRMEVHLAGTVTTPDEIVTWVQPMGSPLEHLG